MENNKTDIVPENYQKIFMRGALDVHLSGILLEQVINPGNYKTLFEKVISKGDSILEYFLNKSDAYRKKQVACAELSQISPENVTENWKAEAYSQFQKATRFTYFIDWIDNTVVQPLQQQCLDFETRCLKLEEEKIELSRGWDNSHAACVNREYKIKELDKEINTLKKELAKKQKV